MTVSFQRRAGVALAAMGLALPLHAGPAFEHTLARHRALLAGTPGEPADTTRSGMVVTPALGGPPGTAPWLMAPDLPLPQGGLRVAASFCLAAAPGARSACAGLAKLSLTAPSGGLASIPQSAVLAGSVLAVALPFGEAYASVQARHWGPGWAGSLILDGAATALPAIGWRQPAARAFETPALAWLGPWTADVFFGALEGHAQPVRPWLIGMRFGLEPLPGVRFAVSRSLQWGGRGRREDFSSLLRALSGRDNVDTPSSDAAEEPGNQLAGYDLRVALPFLGATKPVALYVQAIGEDEAGSLPSKHSALAGADVAWRSAGIDGRVFLEWADTVAGRAFGNARPGTTYRHHIYQQGYTHAGAPLGHPIGGDARIASAGLIADAGAWSAGFVLHRGRAAAQAQRLPALARLSGLDATLTAQVATHSRVSLALWSWRVGAAARDTTVQAAWAWAWDW